MGFNNNLKFAEERMNEFSQQSFVIKHGEGGIMFSAPHSVEQLREGKIKYSEKQTGILVEMLYKELGCPIIKKTANCNDDANYDRVCAYKDALAKYILDNQIHFLVDLHQLSPSRNVMVNFGTGDWKNLSNKSLLNIFLSTFSKYNLGVIQLDEPFDGSYEHTVSSTIHRKCKIPCMQIELNTRLVNTKYEEYSLELVYKALCECFYKLKEFYG